MSVRVACLCTAFVVQVVLVGCGRVETGVEVKQDDEVNLVDVVPRGTIAGQPVARAPTPQQATGPTPVRYIICFSEGTDCSVAARYADMNACKKHQRFWEQLCDVTPSRIECSAVESPNLTSYCLPENPR